MSKEDMEKRFLEINNPLKVMESIKEAFRIEKILKSKLTKKEFRMMESSFKEGVERALLTGYFCGDIEKENKDALVLEGEA